MVDVPPPPKTTVQAEPETQGPSQDMAAQFQELKRRELDKGAILGRFVILSQLGQGGMGVVYLAYDPELDRKVAIKLLHPVHEGDPLAARARLLREAQAMARLDDPNVIAIHDVGTFGDEIWLAMEHVEGRTLDIWWKEKQRRWPEILRIMIAVGRGLAAAHRKGLVHRDIKPANIMISASDRARVMDFGLVCAPVAPRSLPASAADVASPTQEVDLMAAPVTRTGAVLGTAAYMAAEQHDGKPVDASADQFAFCVTLWEALYGELPFLGSTLAELAAEIRLGKPRPPPAGSRVPAWLHRAMLRAFRPDPKSRYDSMPALLDILERGRTRARVRFALAVLVGAATLATGAWTYRLWDLAQRTAACEADGESIAAVWSTDAKQRVHDAFLATGVSYAAATSEKVVPWLDKYSVELKDARVVSCLNGNVSRRWDAELLDRSDWCLEERKVELDSLVSEFEQADATTVQKAVPVAARLRAAAPCLDESILLRQPRPPMQGRDDLRNVRVNLARAQALGLAGNPNDALELVKTAREQARLLGWPPLWAAARAREGDILEQLGKYRDAAAASAEAYFEAASSGAWEVAAGAATELVGTVGNGLAQNEAGHGWADHARMATAHAGDHEHFLEASRLGNLGNLYQNSGAYEDAKAHHERALAIREKALGSAHPDVASTLNNLGNVCEEIGDYVKAKEHHERALSIWENALGPDHPTISNSLSNLANVYHDMGDYERATALHERALKIRERALGLEHPDVATTLTNLAIVRFSTGEKAVARALEERALIIKEKVFGPAHPNVANSLNNLASILEDAGAYGEAQVMYERALAIRETTLGLSHANVAVVLANLANLHLKTGAHAKAQDLLTRAEDIWSKTLSPDHPNVASCLTSLALVQVERGRYGEARALHERALAIWERAFGPDHPDVAWSLSNLAAVHLAQNQPQRALPLFERGLGILEKLEGDQSGELAAHFGLARALVARRGDLARAIAEARKARDGYMSGGASKEKELAEVERWLTRYERRGSRGG